jgi:transketolase
MRQTSLNMVHEMAREDKRVLFIGSDLGAGTLEKMRQELPAQWYMEGVAEQNLIGMSAGLALEGFVPYINTIATFLTRRCFEQVAIDLCLHNLPVRLLASGGGYVYAPLGPTHLAHEDIAILRTLPNMTIIAPSDAQEMRRTMRASLTWPGPMYIRFGKGGDPVVSSDDRGFEIGKAIEMRPGRDLVMITTGVMTGRCLQAAETLSAKGIAAGVLHMHTIKPLDAAAILAVAGATTRIVTVEEHALVGGLGSAVLEVLSDADLPRPPRVLRLGFPDAFAKKYGSQDDLLRDCGLQPDQLATRIAGIMER